MTQPSTIRIDPNTRVFFRAQAVHGTIEVINREHQAWNEAAEGGADNPDQAVNLEHLRIMRRALHQFHEQGKRLADLAVLLDGDLAALESALVEQGL